MTTNKPNVVKDLAVAGIGIPVGYIGGYIRSYVNPFTVFNEINHIRDKGINTLSDYSAHLFGALGYGTGVYEIISSLSEDPKDIKNYAPLVTNLIGAVIQISCWAYKHGKKEGLELRI